MKIRVHSNFFGFLKNNIVNSFLKSYKKNIKYIDFLEELNMRKRWSFLFYVPCLLVFSTLTAQTPPPSQPSDCKTGCTSNDVQIQRAFLVDQNNVELSPTFTCQGNTNVKLALNLTTGTPRIGVVIYANVKSFIGGVVGTTVLANVKECFSANLSQSPRVVFSQPINWPCGTPIVLTDVFIGWGTGNTDFCSGTPGFRCPGTSSKCFSLPPGQYISVSIPTANPAAATKCSTVAGGTTAVFDLTTLNSTVIGSQTNVTVTWYSDAALGTLIPTPTSFTAGTRDVWAKVTSNTPPNPYTSTKITLTVIQTPSLSITNPGGVCSPSTIDLTAAGVTSGSTMPAGTALSYWANSDGTGTLNNPAAIGSGTYYIKATTNTTPACFDIKPVTATVKITPGAPTVTVVNNCDGSSDLTASNFTGTLLWSNNATTTSIHVTNAATYTVTQTVNGCTSSSGSGTSAPKTTPAAPTVTVTNNCDGSSDLTASNFTGSLLWSNSATTTSIHVTNAATYTVTQTVNGCISLAGSGTSAPRTTPGAPTVSVVNNCDGSSDLTASNFTGALLWSNNATTASIHVTNAATYTVTQTVNGCISLAGSGTSAPKTTPGAPTVTVTNNCNGSSDLTASNYTGTLLWSNNATTASIHVTNAATYTVTQTVNGCTSLAGSGTSAPKTTPGAPTVTVVNNCNGSSDLTASNFTGALLWSNNATTATIHVTNAATYTVTQTVNGCTSLAGSGTSAPKTGPAAPTVSVTNNCDGSSDLTASNYTGTLLWSNSATTASIHVTNAATYTVTQTVNGCTSLAGSGTSAPKTVPDAPILLITQPSLCNAKGSIKICNPIAGYTYALVGAPGPGTLASGQDVIFADLNAGSNPSITATNAQGCTSLGADCNSGVSECPASGMAKTSNIDNNVKSIANPTDFTVYPVPFKDQLTVKYNFNYTSHVKIEVFNLLGAVILSKEDTNGYFGKEYTLNLNLRDISEQMYVVKVTTNQGSAVKKIISSK